MKYNIHPELKALTKVKVPLAPFLLPFINTLLVLGVKQVKLDSRIKATTISIPTYREGVIDITIYEPQGIVNPSPCLIYLHGGAFSMKATPHHKKLVMEYALRTPCKVVFVDYRLAPKYPFPYGLEDCYAALKWVYEQADKWGIDRQRIAVGGDSAGGALAAGMNLLSIQRKGPRICFQMLVYPVLDARQITPSIQQFTDTPLWNGKLNAKMWQLYLKNGVNSEFSYASPAESPSLKGMVNTYLEVAEFDCLRDEGINFASALRETGMQVQLNKTIGTVHGFDVLLNSPMVQRIVTIRIEALQKAFYPIDGNVIKKDLD